MARIPDSFIEDIKRITNLVELAKEYTELKKVGQGIWQGKCPHPKHNDNTPSFTVWEKFNSWSCYGCHVGKKGNGNYGSDVIAFVQWIHNYSFREAIYYLAQWNNVPIPNDKNQKLYDRNYKLAIKYINDLQHKKDVINYLYDRGLNNTDIENWNIGYDSYNNRIVFPLLDRHYNILGFNKRVINNNYKNGDKYINSPTSEIFNKSNYLYGIHNLDNDFNEIRITEGSLDVILASKYGLKNVVASLGTAFTEDHAKAIAKTGKTPVLIFDGDSAGDKGLYKAIEFFEKLNIYCKIIKLPLNKDLADICLEEKFNIENYINTRSLTAGYVVVNKIIQQYMSSLYELKLQYTPYLKHAFSKVPQIEKQSISQFIKDEINISITE